MNGRVRHFRRGFTFVELLVGMIVTAVVLSAMAAFTYGVAEGWSQGESAQTVFLAGSMAADRFNHAIRSAKLIDPNRLVNGSSDNTTPAATCMYWRDDGTVLLNDGTSKFIAGNSDGKIQFSEMAMIQFDQATKTVWEYTVQFPAAFTNAQIASVDSTQSPPLPLPTANVFKASSYVVAKAIAHNVSACQFYLVPGTSAQRPMLEFVLNIDDGKASTVQYGAATIRCPNEEPQ